MNNPNRDPDYDTNYTTNPGPTNLTTKLRPQPPLEPVKPTDSLQYNVSAFINP